jgi:hypothetical protein
MICKGKLDSKKSQKNLKKDLVNRKKDLNFKYNK